MRQISISTPTVIDTELVPFDESFYIDKNGQLEQWYYDNTEQYAPNRKIIPLMLTPSLSVVDKDSQDRYNPNFQYVRWYAKEWNASAVFTYTFAVSAQKELVNGELPSDISTWSQTVPSTTSAKPYVWVRLIVSKGPTIYETTYAQDNAATTSKYSNHTGGYVETEITNTAESATADYVISDVNLVVRKNVSYSHPVTIRCVVTYIDPRALGLTYDVSDHVDLTTNRTSDVVFPEVEIISPSSRSFNPLTDYEIDNDNFVQKSLFKFNGAKTNSPVQPLNTDVRRYPVDVDGTEEILNSGAGVAPIMDIRYGDNPTSENQEFMYRQTAGGTLVGESIDKAYIERIKGNSGVVEGVLLCVKMNAIQTKGANNSWTKTQTMPITTLKGRLDGAGESVTIFPDGLKKAGNIQDEIFVEDGVVKAIKRVGSRDYESGDESDTSVITDGSATTFYALEESETYVLDPITDFVWYGIKDGQEVLADTLPWYVSGQGTEELTVDAMYAENIRVLLRAKMPDGETLSPSKSYASVGWKVPEIDSIVQSDNGSAVRTNTKAMGFRTIVNVKGSVLSEVVKLRHLLLNWKVRKSNQATEADKGWGQEKTISANDLRYVIGSSGKLSNVLVYPYVYLLGPYEQVTDNGEAVTENGEKVYDRYIE
jgi:hypothetical protein